MKYLRLTKSPCIVAALALLIACESSTSRHAQILTPWGRMAIDYSLHGKGRTVHVTSTGRIVLDSNVPLATLRYGFARGSGVKQTQWTKLVIHDLDQHVAVPENLTRDLWQLDLPSARIDLEYSIPGLTGYQIFGGDGERAFTATFFFQEGRCVGRLVSAYQRLDFMES